MRVLMKLSCVLFFLHLLGCGCEAAVKRARKRHSLPNVLLIVVDDLGWDDVSFHGNPQIATPNIDVLAYDGVILNNYYVQPTSTATRAALMTGMYPIHLGLQHGNIEGSEPYGLPLNATILPEYLKKMNYATHLVGKWHLGFYAKEYTPTERGFDSHYGSYQDWLDQWEHTHQSDSDDNSTRGRDLHLNGQPVYGTEGIHILQLLTQRAETVIEYHDRSKPLFLQVGFNLPKQTENNTLAPPRYKEKFHEVTDHNLKEFVGLMSMLDEAVANISNSLHRRGLLNNSLIVFTTDSGAPAHGGHSNWPLRGAESDLWEGAIRGTAFVWSPLLKKSGKISRALMHVTDILPTILRATGYDISEITDRMDGINMWEVLNFIIPSQRVEILHNIDPVTHTAAMRSLYLKMIVGNFQLNGTNWKRQFMPPIDPPTVAAMLEKFNNTNMTPTIQVIVDGLQGRFDINKTEALYKSGSKCDVLNKILKRLQERAISRAKLMQNNMTDLLRDLGRHSAGSPPLTLACDDRGRRPTPCEPWIAPCLFDVRKDPCEKFNEAKNLANRMKHLMNRLKYFNSTIKPVIKKPPDPRGLPVHNGGVWQPWVELPKTERPNYMMAPIMSQTDSSASSRLGYAQTLLLMTSLILLLRKNIVI